MLMESPSQCAVIHPPPGIAEAPWNRLKSEPKRPLEGNPEEEDDEFNDPEHQILSYFDADIRIREMHEKDEIEKKERIWTKKKVKKGGIIGNGPPGRGGGMCILPTDFDDDIRAEIIQFSQLALEKYNAKIQKKNQGKMFVFHDLVKATYRPCGMHFITFQAKIAAGGGDDAILTFLAKVEFISFASTCLDCSCFGRLCIAPTDF